MKMVCEKALRIYGIYDDSEAPFVEASCVWDAVNEMAEERGVFLTAAKYGRVCHREM